MFFRKTKIFSTAVCVITFFVSSFLFSFFTTSVGTRLKTFYTVCDENDYFSETTHFLSETEFNSFYKEFTEDNQAQKGKKMARSVLNSGSVGEFVYAVNKSV